LESELHEISPPKSEEMQWILKMNRN
jgi:hypothetical protein